MRKWTPWLLAPVGAVAALVAGLGVGLNRQRGGVSGEAPPAEAEKLRPDPGCPFAQADAAGPWPAPPPRRPRVPAVGGGDPPQALGLVLGQVGRAEVQLWAQMHRGHCQKSGGRMQLTCRDLHLPAAHLGDLGGQPVHADFSFSADTTLTHIALRAPPVARQVAWSALAAGQQSFAEANRLAPPRLQPEHRAELFALRHDDQVVHRSQAPLAAAEFRARYNGDERGYLVEQHYRLMPGP